MSDSEVPDIYTDGINLAAGPFGVTLVLYRSDPPTTGPAEPDPGTIVGRVRLSTALAGALADILRAAVAAEAKRTEGTE